MDKTVSFVGFDDNRILRKAIYFYSFFIRNKKVISIPKTNPIKLYKNKVETITIPYDTINYKLQEKTLPVIVDLKNSLEKNNPLIIRWLNKLYKTNKFESVFLAYFSRSIYYVTIDVHHIESVYPNAKFILPNTFFYKKLKKALIKPEKIHYSSILTCIIHILSIGYIIKSALGVLLRNKIKRKKRLKGIILRELVWGLNKDAIIRDNLFVDNKNIKSQDIVYFTISKKGCRENAFSEAINRNNSKIIDFEKEPMMINFNKLFLKNLYYNFITVPSYFLISFFSVDFLACIPNIIYESNFHHRLLSFVDAKWFFSTRDWGDHITTIVSNLYKQKTFLYHWSDYTAYKICFSHQVICHNIVFSWGKVMQEYNWLINNVDIIKNIGCQFRQKLDKEKLRQKYIFEIKGKIISFFDTSVTDRRDNFKDWYEDFYSTIKFIDSMLPPDILILVKTKDKSLFSDKKYKINNCSDRVLLLDPTKYPMNIIMQLSNINIGLGPNSATTISLINNIPGIYYDVTGNTIHPMTKYEGDIFVRNKESLLKSINKYLCFKGNIREIFPEIKDYDVENISDPIGEAIKFLYNNQDSNIKDLIK